ncbi:MAG TPA: hypothetical protein VFZ34_29210 [Blastocatellia bacterium]|nr:hypothetical protein [Blastocatellia bacterium]
MNAKTTFSKLSIALATTFVLVLGAALIWQSNVGAQGSKTFKGAKVVDGRLVPDAGLKLRRVSDSLIEVVKEETTTTGSGPTARRVTKPIRVNGINVKCICPSGGKCITVVRSDGAFCSKDGCTKCEMIAQEPN